MGFDTGDATLPDVGTLHYNGVTFSSLFSSTVKCEDVKDSANRTTIYVKYTLVVTGFVTLHNADASATSTIDQTMQDLRRLLSVPGGILVYKGKGLGNDLSVNSGLANGVTDCAWGPIPEVIEFTPLGASRSAQIVWTVTTCIPEFAVKRGHNVLGRDIGLLQFCQETSLTYDEDGYTGISIKGSVEVAATRRTIETRRSSHTVDDLRLLLMGRVTDSFDLKRFRITKRVFAVSRDKRTMNFEVVGEEMGPFGQPMGCNSARGNFTVRPRQSGPGLVQWVCTLRATYPVRRDWPRRFSWWAFILLLTFRMRQGSLGIGNPPPNNNGAGGGAGVGLAFGGPLAGPLSIALSFFNIPRPVAAQQQQRRVILINFEFDEGVYHNGKTITFSASYTLSTRIENILIATGVWRQEDFTQRDNWVATMSRIQGGASWLWNRLDPRADVIVDLGTDELPGGVLG